MLLLTLWGLLPWDPTAAAPGSDPVAARPRALVVKPVILCDDDGGNPARSALPKKLVDQAYTRAGLEIIYLEPVHWNLGVGRRGETNLDTLVRWGRKEGIVVADPRVLTLLFVTAVDGHPGPLGRGMQNGNICFVSLGPEGRMTDPAERGFVVAHEIGHCLNLRHAVDDPAVPDKSGNLQGDGPFSSRLTVEALHPTQRDTVLKSPLAQERVTFHDEAAARRALSDESWERYLADMSDDMAGFVLGLKSDVLIPQAGTARQAFLRKEHEAAALAFNEEEKALLRRRVERIAHLTGGDWPMVSRLPWHFVKAKPEFCRGRAHTRGLAIVLSPRMLKWIAEDETAGLALLVHEKLHVVQRLNPSRFSTLFREYGFVPIRLADGEVERINLVRNPDAWQPKWSLALGGRQVFLAYIFQKQDDGTLGFAERSYRLVPGQSGRFVIGEPVAPDAALAAWRARFAIHQGHDYPEEISAHLSRPLLLREYLKDSSVQLTPEQTSSYEKTRLAFQQILRLDGE